MNFTQYLTVLVGYVAGTGTLSRSDQPVHPRKAVCMFPNFYLLSCGNIVFPVFM